MKTLTPLATAIALALIVAGCSKEKKSSTAPQIDGSKYLLAEEPKGAKGVTEARKIYENDDEVVVEGRIGGEKNPWIDGLAVFTIVDPSFKACNEIGDDGCPKPWDFC